MATKKDYIAEIRKYPESKFAKLADSTLNGKTINTLIEELLRLNVDLSKFEGIKKEKKNMTKKNAEVVLEMTDESLAYGLTYSNTYYIEYNKHKNPDIFEKIIDDTMLEVALNNSFTIPHKNKEDITYIFGTPEHTDICIKIRAKIADPKYRSGKRKLITKLLNSTNPFYGKLELLLDKQTENNIGKYEFLKELVYLLREYLGIHKGKKADDFKKSHGEVTTPLELVEEMLDTLPKNVWNNPNLKGLDPANGCGAFPCIVILRLMEGLKDFETDEDLRFKHIIEKMIYVCEIQPTNMYLYLFCVDAEDNLKNNIYCGDFLSTGFDRHMKEVWNIDKFDIVIGNPPFNIGQEAKGKRGGGDTLWDQFVVKILNNILNKKGYLCFVHPTLWRKPQSERSSTKIVNKLMLSKQIHFLEMHDSKDGKKVFNAGTRYDFYLLENSNIYKNTKIKDEDGKILELDLKNYDFIANKNIDFLDKIIAKPNDMKCPIIFNVSNYESRKSWVSEIKNDEFKYPLVHTTPMKGNRYLYSSRNDNGHFGISKVIFGDSGIYDVVIDLDGEYGMTQHSMGIEVSSIEEASNLKKALMSDKFRYFLESVMWSNFQIDWRIFTCIKKDFWKEFI